MFEGVMVRKRRLTLCVMDRVPEKKHGEISEGIVEAPVLNKSWRKAEAWHNVTVSE